MVDEIKIVINGKATQTVLVIMVISMILVIMVILEIHEMFIMNVVTIGMKIVTLTIVI